MTRVRTTLLSLALAAPLAAQAPVTRLEDLQVTATRVASPLAGTPAAITVLQGDDLRARGLAFLADALREVPGVVLVQTGSYGAVSGLFLRGGESDYTKVLIDGVPVNAPGGAVNFANLPLDDVARIEIVRGPGSVMYGADAVSGVIQVFTRRGAGRASGDAEWRGGSFGNRDLRGHFGASTGAFDLSAAASRFASAGTYDVNNGYRNANGSLRLGWNGHAAGRVAVTARYGAALAHFPTDGAGAIGDVNQFTDDRDLELGFSADRRLGARVSLTAEGWVHRLDSRFRDAQDDAADTSGFGFAGTRDAIQWRRGAGLRADWSTGPRATLTFGAALERESESQHSVTASDFGFGRDETIDDFAERRSTRSGYAQFLAQPVRGIDVQVGGRLDDNSAFGTFGTWRAGAVWHLDGVWRAWTAFGTGYKAPTFSELFAASAFEVGNPGLRPERSRSAELGLAADLGHVSLGLTGFDQRFNDLIQYVSAAPGDPTYGNLGGARARGLEATATVRFTSHVAFRGHWTWLSTLVTDSGATSSVAFQQGDPLLRRPAMSGGAALLVDAAGAHLAGTVNWVGERDDADFRDFPATRTTLPSYATVDLALEAPLLRGRHGPGVVLVARAENLFDARWDQVVGFPGRGRTLFAGGRLAY